MSRLAGDRFLIGDQSCKFFMGLSDIDDFILPLLGGSSVALLVSGGAANDENMS